MERKKESIMERLRDVYVEKRLDLLKESYEAWEKTANDWLEAMKVNKDLNEIEVEIEKLGRMRQGIESRVRDGVGYTVQFGDFVERAEDRLRADYIKAVEATRRYREDERKQYSVLKEFRGKKIFLRLDETV